MVTDPLTHATTFTLDTLGRTIKEVAADGGVSQWTLNSAGLPTKYTDPLNRVTSYTYASGTADVIKTELPDGGVISMTYDATYHEVTTRTDQLNHTTTYTYNSANGDLLTITDALNQTTTLVWGGGFGSSVPAGLIDHITDPLGRITYYIYNDSTNRRLTTIKDPLNNLISFTYDAAGNLVSRNSTYTGGSLGGLGGIGGGGSQAASVTFTYDTVDRTTAEINALNNGTTYAYNTLGQLTGETDALGRQTTFAYDLRGNLVGETDAVGTADQRRLAYIYDAADRLIATTDGLSHTTSFGYDAVGRKITTTDALNHTTTTAYDLAGEVTSVTDPLGHATAYSYDAMGRKITQTDALAHTTTIAYDLAGNVRSVKDPLNVTTSFAYDADNRRTQTIDDFGGSLQRTTTVTYDAVGNVLTSVDPLGHTTSFSYDAINRETSIKDPLGNITSTTYQDSTHQVATWSDALGFTVTNTYDMAGELTSTTRPDGGAMTYAYDAVGNLISQKDALNHTTTFAYDNLNRQVVTTDALNGKTTIGYDAADNKTSVVDPDGNHTTFAYDAANELVTQTDPLNHNSTFAYDAAGRMIGTTDQNGQRRDFTYSDVDKKLTEQWYSATALFLQTLTFTYDARNEMLTAQAPAGTNTFAYDDLGRTATINEPFGLTLTYSYDAADNVTVVQDSKGGTATMSYDVGNRLTSEQFSGNSATLRFDYAYTTRNQVSGITRYSDLAGTTKIGSTSFTYDAVGQLTHEQHKNGSGTNIENTTLTYDTAGRITQKQVDGTTTNYAYDNTNQLTSDGSNIYGYDANGNRNTGSYATGNGNRTTSDGTWTYSYDNDGNLTKKSKGSGAETWTYGYDNQNHLIWVEQRATDGGTLEQRVTYSYDGLGQRIQRTVDSNGDGTVDETDRYGLDRGNVWVVIDGSNNFGSRHLFGPGTDQIVARVTAGGAVAWYLTDYVNSVTVMVDGSGTVQDRVTYDGFGKIVTETNASFGDGYKYTGREWDASAQLQYNRARYYDANLGKWISMDPMGFAAGDANLYRYVGNNGINNVDPTGTEDKHVVQDDIGVRINRDTFGRVIFGNGGRRGLGGWLDDTLEAGLEGLGLTDTFAGQNNGGSRGGTIGGGIGGALSAGIVATAITGNPIVGAIAAVPGAIVGGFRGADTGAHSGDDFWGGAFHGAIRGGKDGAVVGGVVGAIANILDAGNGGQLGACFVAGTLVATENGRKPIERITNRDRVWSFDFRQKVWRACNVLRTFVREHEGLMVAVTVGNEEIVATGCHPFWVVNGENLARRPSPPFAPVTEFQSRQEGRWVLARDLQVGDEVILRTGEIMLIDRLATSVQQIRVYNFHVEELENFAVGCSEILVHNNNDDEVDGGTVDHLPNQNPGGTVDHVPGDEPIISKGGADFHGWMLHTRGIDMDNVPIVGVDPGPAPPPLPSGLPEGLVPDWWPDFD